MNDLVLQGPGATRAHADALAGRVGGLVDSISSSVFRLKGVPQKEDIAAWCDERKIDHAWVPPGRRFADLGLVAMDMDSTLITIECIDELGDMAGVKPQVAAITEAAMRGELDYPASLRRRVALLKGLEEEVLGKVYEERLRLTPGAEALIAACKRHGVKLLLVSGGFTFFTDRLKDRLGIDYTISNKLEIAGGRLTGGLAGEIVDADAKAGMFLEVMKALDLGRDRTVAIGDGANDLKMMAQAGLSVAFHAKPVVRAQASCALTWSGLDGVLNLFER
jgi:phosphoserine phosphatase